MHDDAALTDADLKETGLTKLGQIHSAGFSDDRFVMECCAAVKREWLGLCLPIPDGLRAHDNWIVGIAGAMGRKRIVPEVLQCYRRHGNNESQWIVNRTTKVTRWHVELERWRHRLRTLVRRPGVAQPPANTTSLSSAWIAKWARETAIRAPEPYASDLRRYADTLLRTEALWEKRRGIRRQLFPQSAFAAAKVRHPQRWSSKTRD